MDSRITSLETHLGKDILAKLRDPNVIEIMLNPDGNLWVEEFGQPMSVFGCMQPTQASLAIKTIAGYHDIIIKDENPVVECELPIDGSRFEGVFPPVVAAPSFTIRKKATKIFTLDEYVESETLSETQLNHLRQAVSEHKNILIVGGTGSGKTTFANALIAEMGDQNPDERMVIIEDTNELQCNVPNKVILRSNENTSMNKLLRVTLRFRPDRILVGEVRGGEALSLLKAWNTGHPGGIATIHADNGAMGLTRLEQCIGEVVPMVDKTMVASAIHLIVFIRKSSKGRKIEELIQVTGVEGNQYQYEYLS